MSNQRTFDAWRARRAAAPVPDGFIEEVVAQLAAQRPCLLERSRLAQAALWLLAIGALLLRTGASLLPFIAQ
jgi:hypothetical protein